MKGLITSQKDRDNLNFLLNASKEVYAKWMINCTYDDLKYAEELLTAYCEELKLVDFESSIEHKLELMNGEFTECRELLKKFHVY